MAKYRVRIRRIKGERWMLQATSPRKLGLD